MMDSAFHLLGTIKHFLFEGWSANTAAAFAGVCVFVAMCAFFIEALKLTKTILWNLGTRSPLAAAPPSEVKARPEIVRDLMIPSSVGSIRKKKIQIHIGLTFLHVVELVFGYLLMLAVMTYNGYIAITVVVASGLSYYFLGPFRVTYRPATSKHHGGSANQSEDTITSHLLEDGGETSINDTAAMPPPCHTPSDNEANESHNIASADVHM